MAMEKYFIGQQLPVDSLASATPPPPPEKAVSE